MSSWQELTGALSRHSLVLGSPGRNDVVLHEEVIRRESNFLSTVSHTFSYVCKAGEEITAVLAYDMWDDDTGGHPQRESGGVGQREVSISVTSQFNRGLHFHFMVYGKLIGLGDLYHTIYMNYHS